MVGMSLPSDSLAWGTASPFRLSSGLSMSTSSILLNTWAVNAPQLGLSILYVLVNTYLTRLCLAVEWNEFGKTKECLRVTSPTGEQRSTHFLQLPFRYAVPLTAFAGVLHWLVSQSLFLQRLEMKNGQGDLVPSQSYCTCGWSGSSTMALLGAMAIAMVVVVLRGSASERITLPPAVDCSLAISAACHPPPDDVDASLRPVHWGVVQSRYGGIGHCTITSLEASRPVVGMKYA